MLSSRTCKSPMNKMPGLEAVGGDTENAGVIEAVSAARSGGDEAERSDNYEEQDRCRWARGRGKHKSVSEGQSAEQHQDMVSGIQELAGAG